VRSALLVLSLGAAAGCTTLTPTEDPVYLRLQDLDARLGRIERVVNNESLVQLATQVDQLQAETQALRGDVETLRHDTEGAGDRQRQLYLDVDRRLQSLEQGQGRLGLSGSQGQGGLGADAGAQSAGAFGGGSNAGQSSFGGGATTAGGATGAGGFGGGTASSAGGGTQPNAAGNDQDVYQAALDLIQARRYTEAADAFDNFLAVFPQSPLADNAQYWLAETHYVQRDFTGALAEFQKVIDQYPRSAKIPDALLKVGYCNYELKQFDQARAALQQVTREYPDTTAARLASQRLDRIVQDAG
jgi:tol-pal system protein YbgF